MSTNYFLHLREPHPLGREVHLGLSTHTSRFLFQAHKAHGITSLAAWKKLFAQGAIVSEYGNPLSTEDFLAMVDAKQASATHLRWWEELGAILHATDSRFLDDAGYSFDSREFN